ncbi:hypothetical protein [Saccharothrix variisporea]|uniref:Uncharacterized protein n=1 Tax=Saccharothrix variisporea TaxID=543527 RepID=A0A495XDK2_9PSEU|nr:hypothetical protein [Saccharothrix variisporea]RKT71356.1 hypothetical protein DFJ66_4645 [Saccharothrix variisporea]
MDGRTWTAAELRSELDRYEAEAMASRLKSTTKLTYIVHARRFLDWLDGGYKFPEPPKTADEQV